MRLTRCHCELVTHSNLFLSVLWTCSFNEPVRTVGLERCAFATVENGLGIKPLSTVASKLAYQRAYSTIILPLALYVNSTIGTISSLFWPFTPP